MHETITLNAMTPELLNARKRAKQLCMEINALRADQMRARKALYSQLFGRVERAYIEPTFFCDYGSNIFLGDQFYANHHCVILDAADVHIGARVMLGPNVHLYTTTHPLNAAERRAGVIHAAPITLGDDVWIGGGAMILPGVSIGDGAVIAAGAIVTRDIPAHTLAVGNPARVQKSHINQE